MSANPGYSGIGAPLVRREDLRLVSGQGCYSDDFRLAGQVHAVMLRSPHAHARIIGIDTTAAAAAPGVIAVLTGADFAADKLKAIPHRPTTRPESPDIRLTNSDGSPQFLSTHVSLPADRVRFIGEAVAMVIAETVALAKDAAETIDVNYEPLPAATQAVDALAEDAPRVWDALPSNVCLDALVGDRAGSEEAFAKATHVVRLQTQVQRVTAVPMEPRAALAAYDRESGRTTLYAGSGGTNRQKTELATVLGVPEETVRVIAREVGGNFGTRNNFYPEFALVAWAARRIGRPVKWTCERQEAFLSDYQGRDLYVDAELALDAEGNFLAVRSTNVSNVGAYTVSFTPLTKGAGLMSGVYAIGNGDVRARAVLTNTPATNPYRSAGRPEAMFVIERLIDMAAQRHGFDRVALRRRNLIGEKSLPYRNPFGVTYDSGTYRRVMDQALALGDWDGFAKRRAEARKRGKRRGIGVANYVEITSGAPREWTRVTVSPDGSVEFAIGTLSSGQGHETSFAQVVGEMLGVPVESVRMVSGDTDVVEFGGGSHSGRSMRLAGIVIGKATNEIVARGKRIAAHVLEAAETDVEFTRGRFTVQGTDRSLGIFEVAEAAVTRNSLPEDLRGPLSAVGDETVGVGAYPYGSHVCEVEVDPDTGAVKIVRYAAVDDVGRAVNPLILHGQAHGGIVQGVGQAVSEQIVYDSSGQLLSGSFMDYAMPRADAMPSFDTEISEVPAPSNPLGIRAGGEGGTTPALAVVVNAIVHALAEYGVEHIDMPATPERVWRAIQTAQHIGNSAQ